MTLAERLTPNVRLRDGRPGRVIGSPFHYELIFRRRPDVLHRPVPPGFLVAVLHADGVLRAHSDRDVGPL